ncbi:MAG: SdrD B-like domain-containing protein, partial [Pirellulales bacterium]
MLARTRQILRGGENGNRMRRSRLSVESLEARQVLSASIGGSVWIDTNGDGVRDAGETETADGFTVYAFEASGPGGAVVASAPVSSGQYSFSNLPAGDYVVTLGEEFLSEYSSSAFRYSPLNRSSDESMDSDINPTTAYSAVITLADGQATGNVDAGMWRPARIQGSARFTGEINDESHDFGLAGIEFTLYETTGGKYAEFTTDVDGEYSFAEVPEGNYYLAVKLPDGATVAVSTGDYPIDAQTLRTATFHLTGGTNRASNLQITTDTPVSIGGRLWHDLNANGVQDDGEPGIEGRRVNIVGDDIGGSPTTITDVEGNYRFDGLPPARYALHVDNYHYSPYSVNYETLSPPRQTSVDAQLDSDFQPTSGDTPQFLAEVGGNLLDFDAGLFYRGDVHGAVWDDTNGDGVQGDGEQAMPSAEVRLLREDGSLVARTVFGAYGGYHFTDLLPGSYFLEFVRPDGTEITSGANPTTGRTDTFTLSSHETETHDVGFRGTSGITAVSGSAWDDANGDGIRQAGELPIAGVGVDLLLTNGAFIATATTNAAGNYQFAGIAPSGYMLRFTPAAGTYSPMNRGDDSTDSDVNRGTGLTAPFPIFAGQTDATQDVGIYTGALSTDVASSLRVTEVGFVGHSNSEFVEVRNIGDEPIDLTGVRFTKGISYNFSSGLKNLFPGEYGVVVGDFELLSSRTDVTQINVLGLYSGDINREERLTILDATGQTVLSFRYDDDWFVLMDRETMPWTLSVIDDTIAPELWEQRSTWRPSSNLAGSPGRPDPGTTPNPGAILINEVLTKSLDGFNDLIELRNTTDADIDIGGWYLGDSQREVAPLIYLTRYRIPGGTIVPANGYLVLSRESDFGVFGLSSYGETLHLVAGDEYGAMAGYAESVSFGGTEVGVSFGRYENAGGVVDMLPQQTNTFGAANSGPRVGPVVISEIMYHPLDGAEFIELVNTSASPVNLGDPVFGWELHGDDLHFQFAQGTVLEAGARAIVTSGSPTDFRVQHGLGLDVIVAGPWHGSLPNGGGKIELVRNDNEIQRRDGKIQRRQFLVDRVTYDDTAPWPIEADGTGASLERISLNVYGNNIANWMASETVGGTPGLA